MTDFQHVSTSEPVTDPYGEIRLPVCDVARRLGVPPTDIVMALREFRLSVTVAILPPSPIIEISGRVVR